MHTGKRYTPFEFIKWTRRDIYALVVISSIPTLLYYLGFTFMAFPWQPIAIVGTALAFIVGFKNNASYGRLWEARQIYGAIINDSRSLAYTLRDVLGVNHQQATQTLFYRHFAWLTALRYQLRESRPWENMQRKSNLEFLEAHYQIPESLVNVDEALKPYLSPSELAYVLGKKNKATQLTAMQSQQIAALRSEGVINDFQWTQLQQALVRLTDSQGRAERIKNFPYPRNFSSVATYLMFIFVVIAPFGLLREMDNLGKGTLLEGYTIWFNIPFITLISWAFHTLDTIGESSVNPFEGSANDIPITQISRTIEIDMRDMLNEQNLPEPITATNNIVL